MTELLRGIRVVDATVEVGELCGRLLADLGADVIRVEPPGGSPSRSLPPYAPDGTGLWWLYRNTNKRAPDAVDLAERLRATDVLLGPASPELGLTEEWMASIPGLVTCTMTWFGATGPYAGWQATDDVIIAMSGWLSASGVPERPPLLVPGSLASDAAAVMGAFAVLTALYQRRTTGRGQHIDVSALEATVQVDTWSVVNASHGQATGAPARRTRGGPAMYPAIPTADGAVKVTVISPRQWHALWDWMGRPDEFADPSWAQPLTRFMRRDELNPALEAFLGSMTMQQAAEEAQRRGIAIVPMHRLADVLADAHLRERGALIDAEIAPGLTARFPAGIVEVDGVRAGMHTPPPQRGETLARPGPARAEGGGETAAAGQAAGEEGTAVGEPPTGGPLAGIRVLDFGHGGVGVQCGRLLAEHGADVIKVESRSYPDFMRLMGANETSPSFVSSSRSKRSFGVNLKHPDGIALVKRLAAESDVVIENNSTGTMAALGIGWDELQAANPALVMLSSQLIGARGPRAAWTGYGPSVQAYGGLSTQWAFPGDRLPPGTTSNHPDMLAGHLCAVAALAAVFGRGDSGSGGHVEMAQVDALIATVGDLLMAESLSPGGAPPDGNDDLRGDPWGVFPCAGDQEWCVICVRGDVDWASLRRAMGEPGWAAGGEWAGAAGRRAGREELAGKVAAWTAGLTPDEVTARCQAEGVPAGPMRHPTDLLADPQLVARGFLVAIDQPDIGPLVLDGRSFIASDLAPPIEGPAPRLGQHTREICRDRLGLDHAEIDRLIAAGVLEVTPAYAGPAPSTS